VLPVLFRAVADIVAGLGIPVEVTVLVESAEFTDPVGAAAVVDAVGPAF